MSSVPARNCHNTKHALLEASNGALRSELKQARAALASAEAERAALHAAMVEIKYRECTRKPSGGCDMDRCGPFHAACVLETLAKGKGKTG